MKAIEQKIKTVRPVVNIYEKEDTIILEAEMPGVEQSSINVEVQNDTLEISARRKLNEPDNYTNVFSERISAEYKRTFTLASEIDKEKINAKYENGILIISLQKREETKPKKIEIK